MAKEELVALVELVDKEVSFKFLSKLHIELGSFCRLPTQKANIE